MRGIRQQTPPISGAPRGCISPVVERRHLDRLTRHLSKVPRDPISFLVERLPLINLIPLISEP
jgi:hypothetical protein